MKPSTNGEDSQPEQPPDRPNDWALEQLPEGVLVTDATGTIRWANPGAAELTGWQTGELRGMRLDQLISRDELSQIARARGVAGPQALHRYHCTLRTAAGEQREVSVSVGAMGETTAAATLFLLRDIRRQREQERRLLAQLAEKQEVEAFGRVAALVLHDLRHLNNIVGLTVRNFRQRLAEPAFCHEALQTLEEVARDMKSLMEKLSGSPSTSLHRQATTLGELVRCALERLVRAGWQAAVAETAIRGLDQPLPCQVDLAEMRWALFNLLLNAYEAMEGEGQVSVTAEPGLQPGQLRLRIEDTGPGLPRPYRQDSLFRPFRSTKPNGWGLGLCHAKRIIEAHGGSLEVATREEGRGTRVTITLPAVEGTAPHPCTSAREEANGSAQSSDR